jgi:hypothetical protein
MSFLFYQSSTKPDYLLDTRYFAAAVVSVGILAAYYYVAYVLCSCFVLDML